MDRGEREERDRETNRERNPVGGISSMYLPYL
jgi:hypothetical protein